MYCQNCGNELNKQDDCIKCKVSSLEHNASKNEQFTDLHDGCSTLFLRALVFYIDIGIVTFFAFLIGSMFNFDDETSGVFSLILFLVYFITMVCKIESTLAQRLFGWKIIDSKSQKTPSVFQMIGRIASCLFVFTGIGALISFIFFLSTGNVFFWEKISGTKLVATQTNPIRDFFRSLNKN